MAESNPDKNLKDDQSTDKLSEVDPEVDVDSNTGAGSDTHVLNSDEDFSDYKKTLRLRSDQWNSLNLKNGKNKVTFTVTTRYQVHKSLVFFLKNLDANRNKNQMRFTTKTFFFPGNSTMSCTYIFMVTRRQDCDF